MDASSTLPNELWIQILGHLSKKDLKALRVCGDNLTSLASSLLFSTAYVAARKGVLDTFTALTTYPIFRHHVKEVIFDSSWIDPGNCLRICRPQVWALTCCAIPRAGGHSGQQTPTPLGECVSVPIKCKKGVLCRLVTGFMPSGRSHRSLFGM